MNLLSFFCEVIISCLMCSFEEREENFLAWRKAVRKSFEYSTVSEGKNIILIKL